MLTEKILEAGVVGAGGAGFPTHIKAKSKVETVLANGAECEPLLHKDYEIMLNFPGEIIHGMNLMMENTGAKKGYFGIKSKNKNAISAIESEMVNKKIEMCFLGDFYPSGDEYELVYAATKRHIPPHGIPLDIGCVVNNVETFYNIHKAEEGIPVTDKFICVAGAINNPSSFFAPVGSSLSDVLEFAGGVSVKDYGVFVSGVMMGKLTFDMDEVITKTTSGLVILPREHYLIQRMNRSPESMNKIGKSACDQCSYCTEFCPRYLLGYDVQPHKVMRSLVFTTSGKELWNQYADLCCACGICSLYSCPEDLFPREACVQSKAELKAEGVRYEQQKPVKVHPIHEGRRIPLKQLMKKTNLEKYAADTPFLNSSPAPSVVRIPLAQHIGSPAKPIVKMNTKVGKGDVIGEIPDNKMGAKIHSSISGEVIEITSDFIRIRN